MHLTQFVLVALPLGVKCWSVLTQCLCQCLYVFSFRHSTFRPRSSRDQVKGCWGSNPPCLYCCQHWQLLIPFLDPFPPLRYSDAPCSSTRLFGLHVLKAG
ncbi:hypothetical protein M758_6G036800 [Ceratodon purpureus]|nr:hypothetical protein M758_6G036800 [Ceratodon purpureus]